MNAEIITILGVGLNFILAYLVKKGAGPTLRKMIPILNVAVGVMTQIGAAATQATTNVVPAVAVAGFFGTFGRGFLDCFVNGLIQGLLTTGVHSTQKNLVQAASAK